MKLNNFLSVLLVVVILFSFAYLDNVFATTINYGLLGSNYSGQSAVRRSIPSLGAAGSLQATIKNGAVAAPFFVATNKQIINGSDTTLYPDAPDAVSSFPYASTTVLWADKSITTKEITAASSSLGYASTTALTISSGNLYLDNSGKSAIINIANSMVLDTKYGGLGMSIDPSSNSLDQIKNILFYVNGNGALTTLNMGDGIGKVLESNGDSLSWKTDEVGRGTATALDQVVTPDSSINSIPYIVSDPNTGHSKLTTSANFVLSQDTFTNNNFGIGTSSPWAQLSINSDGILGNAPIFVVGSSAATKLIMTNSGDFGEGTTSPSAHFAVTARGTGTDRLFVLANNDNSTELYTVLSNGWIGASSSSPSARFAVNGDNTNGNSGRLFALSTNNIEKFTLLNNGWIGAGTTSPSARFAVSGDGIGSGRLFALADHNNREKFTIFDNGNIYMASTSSFGIGTTSPWGQFSINADGQSGPLFAVGSSTETQFVIDNGGHVGIGTTTPLAKISVKGDTSGSGKLFLMTASDSSNERFSMFDNGDMVLQGGTGTTSLTGNINLTGNLRMVGGVVVNGAVLAGCTGVHTPFPGCFDFAEKYDSVDALSPGDIVMTDGGGNVLQAMSGFSNKIIGIVSTRPGMVLGTVDASSTNSYPIALSGRVPVKVSMENGPIAIGDKITISSVAGVGMKAEGNVATVGTALESYSGEPEKNGEILVFVILGWNNGTGINVVDSKFNGGITVGGPVVFDKDTVGEAKILSGATEVQITFASEYKNLPIVTASPMSFVTRYKVDEVNKKGFKIKIDPSQSDDALFSWHSFTSNEGKVFVSDGSIEDVRVIVADNSPKADAEAPVITLVGDATSTLKVGDSYADLGATVIDNVDKNLGVQTTGSVDTSKAGVYTLYYNAADNAGNRANQLSRVVTVFGQSSSGRADGSSADATTTNP